MKRIVPCVLVTILLIALVVFSGCSDDNGSDSFKMVGSEKGMNQFVDSSNGFAFDMYDELAVEEENMFFSPYSISIALGMAYEGARGDTAKEMEGVLDLPSDEETRHEMVKDLQSTLNPDETYYDLSTANAYWLRQGEELSEAYQEIIESYYLAHGEQLDFVGDPKGSAKKINDWVSEETNDRINNLLSPDSLSSDTYLVLTNAIYFKADWKYRFRSEATSTKPFYLSDGSEMDYDGMMRMRDDERKFNYASNSDVKFLQMYYRNDELSMCIILPKDNDIASIEPKVDHAYLSSLKAAASLEPVDITIPKFKFEAKYKLSETLSDMGMPSAFRQDADFTGIKADEGPLWISKVIHQSFIEVNEKGTEAAAATAVEMGDSAGPSEPPQFKEFNADHPFIFFIQHEESGQILFMGKVENPEV